MSEYVFAVIPARGGSKRLPGKNLRVLGDKSLLGHAIESAFAAATVTDLAISTEDPEIAKEAIRHGALVIERPSDLATDETPMVPVLQHAVGWLDKLWRRPDIIVTLQPTSPFRTGAHIDATVALLYDAETKAGNDQRGEYYDSALTVTPASYSPFHMFDVHNTRAHAIFPHTYGYRTGYIKPIAPTYSAYQPSGAVYATRYATLMKRDRIIGDECRALVLPPEESININTELDVLLAEALWARRCLSAERSEARP